jgi:hypothetical protein
MEELKINLECKQDESINIAKVLDDFAQKHEGISFSITSQYSFAPIFDENTYEIVIKYAPLWIPLLIDVVKSLIITLYKNGARIDYDTRYSLAKKMLVGHEPLVCEQRRDSKDYSCYIFITKNGRFQWEYEKGNIRFQKC